MRCIQPKISVEVASAPTAAAARAAGGNGAGARDARMFPAGRSRKQRPDEVRPATLVLLRPLDAVLVAADRDVLRAVVGGDGPFAKREQRGCDAEQPADELLRRWPSFDRRTPCMTTALAEHCPENTAARERQLRLRQRTLHVWQEREGLGDAAPAREAAGL